MKVMFSKEALEYLVGLGKNELEEINGQTYSTKRLQMVQEPIPAELEVTTLTGLVDYLKNDLDNRSEKFIVHVESPKKVSLYSPLRKDAARENYIICRALTPDNIQFDRFLNTEEFNIIDRKSVV